MLRSNLKENLKAQVLNNLAFSCWMYSSDTLRKASKQPDSVSEEEVANAKMEQSFVLQYFLDAVL